MSTGVYIITNKVNGKFYIGSASRDLKGQWKCHKSQLNNKSHVNSYLQNAWNKYGSHSFKFEVLKYCLPDDCLDTEQSYIDDLRPFDRDIGYNLSLVASPKQQGPRFLQETKDKISKSCMGRDNSIAVAAARLVTKGKKRPREVCEKISAGRKGIKFSEEHKANLSKTHWTKQPGARVIIARVTNQNRGKKHSEEHKRKIAESAKKNHWVHGPLAADIIERSAAARRGKKHGATTRANMAIGQLKRRERERKAKQI